MKKLLLIATLGVGSLTAQQLGQYYGWRGSYGPVVSPNSPVGYDNSYQLPGEYSPEISSWAYCVNTPFPNAYIQFGFQMTQGCPEGAYTSESASNGFSFDSSSMWNLMVEAGTQIDGALTGITLYIFEWTYDCGSYYTGPTTYYDNQLNPCQY